MSRLRIGVFSYHAAGLLQPGGATGAMGGAEMQSVLLARHLAAWADVHLVTVAPPGAVVEAPPGIRLHVLRHEASGSLLPFLRLARATLRAFEEAGADVLVQRAAGFSTWLAFRHARRSGTAFAYMWASDADADGRGAGSPWIRRLFLRARRGADLQVCQTEAQQRLLPPAERARSIVLPNAVDTSLPWPDARGEEVLWIGSLKPEAKRVDLLLRLAQAMPHRRFRVVGDLRGPPAFQAEVKAGLAAATNMDWAGPVPRRGMPEQLRRARALVNTSDYEGFPNTFLEACASGVPIVSLRVDPNGILRAGAGACLGGAFERMPAAVDRYFEEGPWRAAREAGRKVAERQSPEATARRLLDSLEAVARP